MGHWGVAMSYLQPLWSYPTDQEMRAGAAALQRARATLHDPKVTELEKGHVWALEGFFAEHERLPYAKRILLWEARMERLWQRYPKDTETIVFYALALKSKSLINLEAEGGKIYRSLDTEEESASDATVFYNQRKAGKMLELVLLEERYHPGALHYLIHSYDYPLLAHKALPYAKRYALAAPLVAHALHMPAHIFVRLGQWRNAIVSDLHSMNVSSIFFAKKLREGKAGWRADGMYDEYLHSLDYLVYSYHQIGQDRKAAAFVAEVVRTEHIFPSLTHGSVYSLIAATARSLAETHNWEALAQYQFPLALASDLRNGGTSVGDWASMFKVYLRLLGLSNLPVVLDRSAEADADADRADRLWSIRQEVADSLALMRNLSTSPRLERELKQDLSVLWRITADVQLGVAQAVHEWVEDRRDEAIAILTRMADIEDSYFKPSVKPSVIYPVREHLADKLVLVGRLDEALAAYKATLEQQPLRFNSLLGAAKTARALYRYEEANVHYTTLLQQITGCEEVKRQERFSTTYDPKRVGRVGAVKLDADADEDNDDDDEYLEELEDCIFRVITDQSEGDIDGYSGGAAGTEPGRHAEVMGAMQFVHHQRLQREHKRQRRLALLRERAARGGRASGAPSLITVEMRTLCLYLLLSALLGFAASQAVTHYRKKNN